MTEAELLTAAAASPPMTGGQAFWLLVAFVAACILASLWMAD